MRIRLLLAASAASTLAACGDSSTAPRLSPTAATREITCRSGYHIATREDGSESCEPDSESYAAPTTPVPSGANPPLVAPPADTPPVVTPPVVVPIEATPVASS